MKHFIALIVAAITIVAFPGCSKRWTEEDRARQKAKAQAMMKSSKAAGERMGKSGPASSRDAEAKEVPADDSE